jgi:hypothetical protein
MVEERLRSGVDPFVDRKIEELGKRFGLMGGSRF